MLHVAIGAFMEKGTIVPAVASNRGCEELAVALAILHRRRLEPLHDSGPFIGWCLGVCPIAFAFARRIALGLALRAFAPSAALGQIADGGGTRCIGRR